MAASGLTEVDVIIEFCSVLRPPPTQI